MRITKNKLDHLERCANGDMRVAHVRGASMITSPNDVLSLVEEVRRLQRLLCVADETARGLSTGAALMADYYVEVTTEVSAIKAEV